MSRRLFVTPLGCWGSDVSASAVLRERLAVVGNHCPLRTIVGADGSAYLHRYTLAEADTGERLYLHAFVRGDQAHELHDHPWSGRSLILLGGYREERRGPGGRIEVREFRRGDVNHLDPGTFHRVDLIGPECWTLFWTGPREKSWGFWDRDTDVFTPWRDFVVSKGLVPC